ncbi:hypothetical protein D9611_012481 [Ephemerocybe angulata]|uniref:Glycoside hydrolase family 16 protein n=2 Tax=Ephemerocybe angulata TaxID=980116 RepID=A0A8H6ID98_9AGAR|nr:hypothetical protein D9611_012481 [Tulosesus angulatus]KAF6761686.1 glycoside hydrolase family 16 protein [Tulosesus angulatus]
MQYILPAALLLLLPLEGLAHAHLDVDRIHWSRHSGSRSTPTLRARNNTDSPYKLEDMYQGASFLNDWDFFSFDDPTHGLVNYQTKADAIKKKLAYVQGDGTTVLAVDDFSTVAVGGKRDSVRISSKKTYNGGLFIADFWKMPHGCSVWPAYWSVGPNWPAGGEIDVFEGVNEGTANQYTLHTSDGCTLSQNNVRVKGVVGNANCASSGNDNTGCAFRETDNRSYGKAFNMNSGGVYAHLWNSKGIKFWFFPRGEIPADISSKQPNPDSWGTPSAFFSSNTCDMPSHFYEHSLVIDTTLCGDWAGSTFSGDGCPGTCAQAVANTTIFQWAKWKINYIATYQLA